MAFQNLQTSQTSTAGSGSGSTVGGGSKFLGADLSTFGGTFKFNANDASAAIPCPLTRISPGSLRVVAIGTSAPTTTVFYQTTLPDTDGMVTTNGFLNIARNVTTDSGTLVAFEVRGNNS